MKILHYFTITLVVCYCGSMQKNAYKPLTLKGSESMHETFDALATDFEKQQDTLKIIIQGGGSRTGLMAIKNQTADIGLSSYAFNLEEELGHNHDLIDRIVANDGIIIVNNEKNPLDRLSNEQITAIYSGQVKDWSELGGSPGLIQPIARDINSGTQRFFLDYFGIDELAPATKVAEENNEIVNAVYENANSIGFIGYAYFNMLVREVAISGQDSMAFVDPTPDNLESGIYPLKRSLHIYYSKEKDARISAFLKYLNTDRAKQIIENSGLIPT